MGRKYKREDAIELNRENVLKIYWECLANENTDSEDILSKRFLKDGQAIDFDLNKIRANYEKVRYLYGQLYYRHIYENNPQPLELTYGIATYDGKAWTEDQSELVAFYYLGVAALAIGKFDERGRAHFASYDLTIPTLSPNDPAFAEWAKYHIED